MDFASLRRWSLVRGALALLSLAVIGGCVQDDGHRLSLKNLVIPSYSDDDLSQLGMDADREIREQVEIIDDPVVSGFLNELGQQLVGEIEPQPFVYRFRVIEAPTLNAFAIPGGYIYIHSETLLRVSSIDELAGILGHEIAHIQARHFSRREAETKIPGLVAQVLGMAVAFAAKDPTPAIAGMGASAAMKIKFTREHEAEADQLGAIWITRAGYEPDAMTDFLEKILDSSQQFPDSLPPYLATHPFPDDRIAAIREDAKTLNPRHPPPPHLPLAMVRAQDRLALLLGTRRAHVNLPIPPPNPATTAVLAEANERARAGEIDQALFLLGGVDYSESRDPRVPFRIGELLYESGRYQAAIENFLRTLDIDPSRAQVFYQLGLAFKANGERHRAVYAMEQAILRATDRSDFQRRVEWEIFKLTFQSITDAGFADGSDANDADTPLGFSRTEFSTEAPRLAWWAKLGSRFASFSNRFVVRWMDPTGAIALEEAAHEYGGSVIGSVLEFESSGARAGEWSVELLLENEVIETRSVAVTPHSDSGH
jgi:predicted Zn-dependent protease